MVTTDAIATLRFSLLLSLMGTALHPKLNAWIADIRNDSGQKRIAAIKEVSDLLRDWDVSEGSQGPALLCECSQIIFRS